MAVEGLTVRKSHGGVHKQQRWKRKEIQNGESSPRCPLTSLTPYRSARLANEDKRTHTNKPQNVVLPVLWSAKTSGVRFGGTDV